MNEEATQVEAAAVQSASEVAARLEERATNLAENFVRYEKQTAESNIRYYATLLAKQVAKAEKAEATAKEKSQEWLKAAAALSEGGFEWKPWYEAFSIVVKCDKADLPRLCKAIGRLDGKTVEKEVVENEADTIKLTYKSVRHPLVRVEILRKLKPTDRCKIVKVTREYTELVCDVDQGK